MAGSIYKNTGSLSKMIIRRDRIRIPLWLVGIAFFTLIIPIAFDGMYSSQQERDTMAETMQNPAMTAMVGPGDLNNYTTGAMTTHQMLLFTAIVVGLMSILLVNRHTRADEEDGRIEMIRSLPVGRLSNVNAAILVLAATNVVLAFTTGFGLYALGIESMGLEGSLLYGAVLGVTGIFFTGVTAVFAQLSESSRGVVGYSIAVLLIAYLVRAVGDVSNEALSWLSPLGWVTQTEAYSANNWWPVLLMIGVSIILFILAGYLNAIRDLEAGFFPSRPGRKNATAFLQSPIGLAVRLQRTGTIAWAIGMLVMGLSYGSVLGDLETFFEGNEMLEQMLVAKEGYTLTEQFIPMLMIIMGILSTVPPVMAMVKLNSEEKKNRIEHLLSRAVSRTRLIGSYFIAAAVNGFIMISLAAIGLWSAGTAVMEDSFSFDTIYGAALVYYPAILVMIGAAVLLIGILPKLTSLIWLYVFYSFIVLYLGGLFQFPEWAGKLSPFGYIPQLPVEDMKWMPIIALTIMALVLVVFGFIGYKKRDIEG
ncbi:ABC transporter permease [Virgibacillus oceani]|uniref:ABC transporter permease n=1 Tax=Virgibacillus oceani TaxID=1479511 RepID=A0A917M7M0_9BACI|nr:ABC transporter permease [Virgibacillus oceani]GGG80246.1 ABC transporter permease [Virgibacillus oceani]